MNQSPAGVPMRGLVEPEPRPVEDPRLTKMQVVQARMLRQVNENSEALEEVERLYPDGPTAEVARRQRHMNIHIFNYVLLMDHLTREPVPPPADRRPPMPPRPRRWWKYALWWTGSVSIYWASRLQSWTTRE